MVSGYGSGALWLVGLDVGPVLRYGVGMPDAALAAPRKESAGLVRSGLRLTAVQLKQEIHDSGICHVALEMATRGKRPIVREDDDGESVVEWEDLSEAAHVDMIKFIVKKVLPDAKEYDSVDDRKALDRWASVIAAEAEPIKDSANTAL